MNPRSITLALILSCGVLHSAQADDPFPGRYTEPPEKSAPVRQHEYDQMNAYIQRLQDAAPAKRDTAFKPDFSSEEAFYVSTVRLRDTIRKRIGFPPPLVQRFTKARFEQIADDPYATVYRMWIEALEGVDAYAIFSVPHGLKGPAPLLICQHGGGGNPELIHGMLEGVGTGNYDWMTQRALREGYVTLEPALIFPYGGKEPIQGPPRRDLDQSLQYLGTSILAVELWKIFRCIDAARARPEVDRDRIGMMGLSYGGLYTLYATALDDRILAAVSACFFNERRRYPWTDWSFAGFMNEFNDAEVCALICPRPFMIEVGDRDPLFAVEGAQAEAVRARRYWEGLGVPDRFVFHVFSGGHEFKSDGAFAFINPLLKKGSQ